MSNYNITHLFVFLSFIINSHIRDSIEIRRKKDFIFVCGVKYEVQTKKCPNRLLTVHAYMNSLNKYINTVYRYIEIRFAYCLTRSI